MIVMLMISSTDRPKSSNEGLPPYFRLLPHGFLYGRGIVLSCGGTGEVWCHKLSWLIIADGNSFHPLFSIIHVYNLSISSFHTCCDVTSGYRNTCVSVSLFSYCNVGTWRRFCVYYRSLA